MSQQSWTLQSLSPDVILPILMKMTNPDLCRMRRTCSSMNNIAEDNEQTLSRRSIPFTRVSITMNRINRNPFFPEDNWKKQHRENFSFQTEIDYYKWSMSGISVKLMNVYGIRNSKSFGKLHKFFDEVKPTVDTLFIEDMPPEAAMELLKKINFISTCVVKQKVGANQPSTTEFIRTMAESPHRSKLGLYLDGDYIQEDEHFPMFKDFREIEISRMIDADTAVAWIWKFSTLEDLGHLRRVSFHARHLDDENIPKLWSANLNHFQAADYKCPVFLTLVVTPTHGMFVLPFSRHGDEFDRMVLVFVSKTSYNGYLELFETLEDLSPAIHEDMPEIRRSMETETDDHERFKLVKHLFDIYVATGGFFKILPWTSNFVCFKP